MKTTDMRAKARAIFGPAIAEPMPNQPNGAKALQQRANARPIPTYKVGGPVKKMPTPAESAASGNRMAREEADEMRFMEMMEKKKRPMPSPAESVKSGNRMAREEGAEMRKMRMAEGGKMPDLTGDGKVTRADVLKGRGVKGFAKGGVQTSSDTARKLATEMGGMRKGGKVKPVELDMKGLEEMSRPRAPLPNLENRVAEARNLNTVRAKETSEAAKGKSFKEAFAEARRDQGPNGVFTWRGNTYNTKMAGETSKAAPTRAAAPAPTRAAAPAAAPAPATRGNAPAAAAPTRGNPPAAPANKPVNTGSPMSSVIRNLNTGFNLDAEAKKLMAKDRGLFGSPMNMEQAREAVRAEAENVRKMSGYRAEQERKKRSLEAGRKANPDLVSQFVDMTMNPGYKKGGKVKEAKPKNSLAVMIAIGKPMKPAKKMNGGAMAAGSKDMEASKVTRAMAMGGDPMGYMGGGSPMGYAAGGAGKTRKGQAPIKKAQGGAAKVRKGMMTPEGNIIDVMNKMRGK
jgi:hypothetical protein